MSTIFIDSDYKCHLADDGTMRKFEIDFFDDKCPEFVEGYRFIPYGETWKRDDGSEYHGELIIPWRSFTELAEIQNAVERNDAVRDAELAALIEEIYQMDLEVIG